LLERCFPAGLTIFIVHQIPYDALRGIRTPPEYRLGAANLASFKFQDKRLLAARFWQLRGHAT